MQEGINVNGLAYTMEPARRQRNAALVFIGSVFSMDAERVKASLGALRVRVNSGEANLPVEP